MEKGARDDNNKYKIRMTPVMLCILPPPDGLMIRDFMMWKQIPLIESILNLH